MAWDLGGARGPIVGGRFLGAIFAADTATAPGRLSGIDAGGGRFSERRANAPECRA